jgi:hypothetical protein
VKRTTRRAEAGAKSFARQVYEATLDADPSQAVRAIQIASVLGRKFDQEAFVASIELNGVAQAIAEFEALDSVRKKLDGQRVNLRFGTSGSGVRTISEEFRVLANNLRNIGTLARAASIPFLAAGIAAAIPTVGALAASIVGLSSALGSGLVGAAAAASGALGTLGGALGLVAAPVAMLLGTLKKYDESLEATKAAQEAAKASADSYTEAQRNEARARQNLAQVTADNARQIKQAEADLKQAREDGAEGIEEQERALYQTRRDGAAKIRQEEHNLSLARKEAVKAVEDQERQLKETRRQGRRGEAEAEAALAETRRSAVQSVADQERALRDTKRQARESEKAAEEALEETRTQAVEAVKAQELSLRQARSQSVENNKQAEEELRSAREQLASSTRSMTAAQDELNRALMDEPLRQQQATLDLADARDRATDSQYAYNEAVREFGVGSEEADDAHREMRKAALDLQMLERETIRTRQDGTSELVAAKEAAKGAAKEQEDAAKNVEDQEKNVRKTRREGIGEIRRQTQELKKVKAEQRESVDDQIDALSDLRKENERQIRSQQRLLNRAREDADRSIQDSRKALNQVRSDNARLLAEQKRLLSEARVSADRSIREQERAVTHARMDARRDEAEQIRQLSEAREDALRQENQAEQALEETRRQAARSEKQALQQLNDTMRQTRKAAKELREAKKGLKDETVKLTPAQRALYKEYERFQKKADKFFQPAQDSAARLGVRILKLAGTYLPELGKASNKTVKAIAAAFGDLSAELAKPVQQAGIRQFLEEIPRSAGIAVRAAGKLTLALFNVFTKTLPYQRRLLKGIGDIASRFLRWTQSARGQNAIERFFANAWKRAKQLWNILKDLSAGIKNIFDAANEAGLDDQAIRGLQTIAGGLRKITKEGSEGRKTLERFFKNSKALMRTMGGTALEVAKQVGRVATEVIGFREKGSKLTVLQGIFRGIRRSAKPMADTLLSFFKNVGPAIKDLLPALSRFVRTLGRVGGDVIKTTLNILTRILKAFNNMPGPIKRAIVQLAALKLALKFTGIGALAGAFLTLGKRFGFVFGNAKKLGGKAGLGAVAGGLGRIATITGAGIGIAALAAAFYLAYKNNEKFRKGVNDTVQRLRAFGENSFNQVRAAFRDIFDLDQKSLVKNAKKSGDATASAYAQATKGRIKKQLGEGEWQRELGFKIGQLIGKGMNAVIEGNSSNSAKGIGERIRKLMRTGANPVQFGRNLEKDIRKGMRSQGVSWKNLGGFLVGELAKGTHDPTWKNLIMKGFNALKERIREHGWFNLGEHLADKMTFGFSSWIRNEGKKKMEKNMKEYAKAANKRKFWEQSGRNSAWGYLGGWNTVPLGFEIGKKIGQAHEWLRKKEGEQSPAKAWMPHGRNAALGWVKGVGAAEREVRRAAVDMARTALDAARTAAENLGNAGLAKPLTQAAEQGRKAAKALKKSIQEVNKVRTAGAKDAAQIEADAAKRINRVQERSAKSQLKLRRDSAKEALKIQKNYNDVIEQSQKSAAKSSAEISRNAQRDTNKINTTFDKIMQRATDGGATQDQLKGIEEERTRKLEETSKSAAKQLEFTQKTAAKEQKLLQRQRDKELKKNAKESAKKIEQIQRSSQKQIVRLQKERDKKLVRNTRETNNKLEDIAKRSAKKQTELAQKQLRETRNFHRKQLRPDRGHRRESGPGGRSRPGAEGLDGQRIRLAAARIKIEQERARAQRSARLADATKRRRQTQQAVVERATSPESPGGKAITAKEMKAILREERGAALKEHRAAAASVAVSRAWFHFFDQVASEDFDHRTSMKADAK